MLKRLHIRNLALITDLELHFEAGFTVLTGETGAGKSILLDALGLIAGGKADGGWVRHGQDRAEVIAEFALQPAQAAWLREQDLADDELLIRRVVNADNRSRAYINGSSVNHHQLKSLGESLIALFGQNDSQTLLKSHVQRQRLDDFGQHNLADVSEAAKHCQQLERDYQQLQQRQGNDEQKIAFLRFQIDELSQAKLDESEWPQLQQDHQRLANMGQLLAGGNASLEALQGEEGLEDRLSHALSLLAPLALIHEGFASVENPLAEAHAQVQEAGRQLKRLLSQLDLDPDTLDTLESRIAELHQLARKHRSRPVELPALLLRLQDELAGIEGHDEAVLRLEKQLKQAQQRYQQAAQHLSEQRHASAARLSEQTTLRVRRLGLPHAQVEVEVRPQPEKITLHGWDEVVFQFCANPGMTLQPLAKVASGGELSRISLALQLGLQAQTQTQTPAQSLPLQIFDEIDTGIGGGVAEIVGELLRELGQHGQVLCVTHQAQVAAQGHQQWRVQKRIENGQTHTEVQCLNEAERIEELARMTGGRDITAATRAHAADLLARAR